MRTVEGKSMPYSVAPGAILEASLRGTFWGQKIMMVRHYWINPEDIGGSSDGATDLGEFLNQWDDAITGISALRSTQVTTEVGMDEVRAQWIYPTRYSYLSRATQNSTGAVAPPTTPQNLSYVVTMQSQAAGRSGKGNIFECGYPTTAEAAGLITNIGRTNLEDLGNFFLTNFTMATSGITVQPIVMHRAAPANSQVIDHYTVQHEVRTQRRRTVGRGI